MEERVKSFRQHISKFLALRSLYVIKGVILKLRYITTRPPELPRACVVIKKEPVFIIDCRKEADWLLTIDPQH